MFPGQSLIKCVLIISILPDYIGHVPRDLELGAQSQVNPVSAPRVGQLQVPHRFLIVNSIIPANS